MVNTSDPAIISWADDGETFVVKDPDRFEQEVIPKFFKHRKFSSFVRQLNFYKFRKIKNSDTIIIDPKVQAETANWWKFRHEYFRKGKPDLLIHIQRAPTPNAAAGAAAVAAAAAKAKSEPVNSEVQTLKKRIEEMSKNIDQLTAMVEKVSLKQEEEELVHKRSRVEEVEDIRPDGMLSAMELDAIPFELPIPEPEHGFSSSISSESDVDFVETLFTNFQDDGEDGYFFSPIMPLPTLRETDPNGPDPELMRRLGEALMLLPREIQEMIVNRLIDAITRTDFVAEVAAAEEGEKVPAKTSDRVPQTPPPEENSLPLAAATLAALLRHYNSHLKSPKKIEKSIPVIPVHA